MADHDARCRASLVEVRGSVRWLLAAGQSVWSSLSGRCWSSSGETLTLTRRDDLFV